jgi:amidohydrolase
MIHGGTKENNLADRVELRGTIRSLDPAVRETLFRETERACQIARVQGGDYEISFQEGYPPVLNDRHLTALARRVGVDLVGPESVHERGPEMGGEDFGCFTQLVPGCFFELGVRTPGQPVKPVHNPHFDADESAIPLGAAALAQVALAYLEQQ